MKTICCSPFLINLNGIPIRGVFENIAGAFFLFPSPTLLSSTHVFLPIVVGRVVYETILFLESGQTVGVFDPIRAMPAVPR